MKLHIPEHILAIQPYKPGKPIEELEREYGIRDAVKLASNENPLGPSPLAVRAVADCLGRLHRYPDGGGHVLTRKIATFLGVDPGQVVLGAGSDDVLGLLCQAFLGPGTEAVIPHPSFLMYENGVRCSGGRPVFVPLASLTTDLEAMLGAVTHRTRMVFVCNPNNPTGTVVDRDRFKDFLDRLPEGVLVVVDEAYGEFVRDPDAARGLDDVGDDRPVIVLRTFSKAYGLAGLRVGYGVMPARVVQVLHRVRQPFNVSIPAQAAAAAALDDTAFLKKTVDLVHQGLDDLYSRLERMGVFFHRTQANFFLVDVSADADRVFEGLLRQGVIVRSMAAYGFPNYIRISVGLPEENARFVDALSVVLRDDVAAGPALGPPVSGASAATQTHEPGPGPALALPKDLVITIDGPAGAGKTTVSRLLARRLNYRCVDTGALYRAVALAAGQGGVEPHDEAGLGRLLQGLNLAVVPHGDGFRILLDRVDVTHRLRAPDVALAASAVSARPVVRRFLLGIQRDIGRKGGAVFEGRDMGTAVFPDAAVKFFLDADPEARALRRYREDSGKSGQTLAKVLAEMEKRDGDDSRRALAPLAPAGDAVIIDATHRTADQVVSVMLDHIQKAADCPSSKKS